MINSRELHQNYNKLYTVFREYIWDYATVECMADLEVAIYKLCPNLDDVSRCLNKLEYQIKLTDISDPDIDDCIDMIYATLDDDSHEIYCKLSGVEEEGN